MKTSLIQLAPNADWRAAVARIRGGAQGRVVVDWPDKGGPRSPRLVLQLMARRSRAKRVLLAVVSGKREVRELAEELGLPLFNNTRQARSAEWGVSAPLKIEKRTKRAGPADLRGKAILRRTTYTP